MCLGSLTEGFDPDPPILDPSAQFDKISTLKETSIKLGEKREELSNVTPVPTTSVPPTTPEPTTPLPMKRTPTPSPTTPTPTNSSGDRRSPSELAEQRLQGTEAPWPKSILPMLSTPTPTKSILSMFTPTPTPKIPTPTTTVQSTYISTPTPSSNVIYTPAPCGFSTHSNKNLQSAYDSLHTYDISGASTALNREIIRRSVYVQRLQPNSSKEVKSYNMDIIAKLNTVLKDLENDTPNLAEDMYTLCMIKPLQTPPPTK